MTLELFAFRYRDAHAGKWVHARYRRQASRRRSTQSYSYVDESDV